MANYRASNWNVAWRMRKNIAAYELLKNLRRLVVIISAFWNISLNILLINSYAVTLSKQWKGISAEFCSLLIGSLWLSPADFTPAHLQLIPFEATIIALPNLVLIWYLYLNGSEFEELFTLPHQLCPS